MIITPQLQNEIDQVFTNMTDHALKGAYIDIVDISMAKLKVQRIIDKLPEGVK